MATQQTKHGTLEMKHGLEISAPPWPDRGSAFLIPGSARASIFIPGSGGFPGRPGSEDPERLDASRVLQQIKQQTEARLQGEEAATLTELQTHKSIHAQLRPGVPTVARNDLITAKMFIDAKFARIDRHLPQAISFYGQYPYFVLGDLLRQRQIDAHHDAALRQPGIFGAPLINAYRSAMELKIEYSGVRTLLRHLPTLTHLADVAETPFQGNEAAWIDSLAFRLNVMDQQRRDSFRLLPRFLQQQILPDPNAPDHRPLVEKLQAYRGVLDNAAHLYRLQVQPFARNNPHISAPLTPPEVDALKLLVADQALGLRNPVWFDYHNALLNQETARHLAELSAFYSSLQARAQNFTEAYNAARAARDARLAAERQAQQAAQLQAQRQAAEAARQAALQAEQAARLEARRQAEHAAQLEAQRRAEEAARVAAQRIAKEAARIEAERQAEEAKRLEAEQTARLAAQQSARVAQTLERPGAMSIAIASGPSAVATVFRNFQAAPGQIVHIALTAAIRGALSALAANAAAAAGALLPGLLVGTVGLLWPSSLGNGERRVGLSLPLGDLGGPDNRALDAAMAAAEPVSLPHALNLHSTEEGLAISVVAATPDAPIKAPVLPLQLNAASGNYEAVIDTPPRVITVTPAVQPGNASTELPASQIGPSVIPGPTIVINDLQGNVTPGYEALDVEVFILRYPAHTNLPAIYLAVGNPYGGTTRGEYSGRMYDPEKAGGPVEKLDWRTAEITAEGLESVRLHISRFGPRADNTVMLDRLERILEGILNVTDVDKRFYTHELRELERYRKIGVADYINPDEAVTSTENVWNHAHTATLEDYQLREENGTLYTEDAQSAYEAAERKYLEELLK